MIPYSIQTYVTLMEKSYHVGMYLSLNISSFDPFLLP
nr:MAG TPA: hypothetical protein [Caudoviricetes sp.]